MNTLFIKDDSFSKKSLRIVDNQMAQMVLEHQRTSLNFDYRDYSVEETASAIGNEQFQR